MYTYQVEHVDDDDKMHERYYHNNRTAAIRYARRMSVAYVVALVDNDRAGHKSYGNGCLMETLGEGFK